MKRLGLILAVLAVLIAIPAMQVSAGNECDNNKVKLCHFDQGGGPHVIEVNKNAVEAHLCNHGDCYAPRWADVGDCCRCECPKNGD
jgi:hypothetical protein